MVPMTAVIIPMAPATRHPTRIAAFTAMAPGDDWARAVISSISSSLIQCSSSTNFFFMKVMITKPPPNVKALMYSVLKNNFQSRFAFEPFSIYVPPAFRVYSRTGFHPAGSIPLPRVFLPASASPARRIPGFLLHTAASSHGSTFADNGSNMTPAPVSSTAIVTPLPSISLGTFPAVNSLTRCINEIPAYLSFIVCRENFNVF